MGLNVRKIALFAKKADGAAMLTSCTLEAMQTHSEIWQAIAYQTPKMGTSFPYMITIM